MKISLAYPKIPDSKGFEPKKCIAFEKYDGTNIHFVWTPQRGFHAFGTRRDRFPDTHYGWVSFDQAHPGLEGLSEVFNAFGMSLAVVLEENYPDSQEVLVFMEYLGPGSFAGEHVPNEKKQLIIFDVMVGACLVDPETFVEQFGHLPIAKVLYRGKYTGQLVEDIRKGKYKVSEGAVIKGVHKKQVLMCKVKSEQYLTKLKEKFKNNWKEYWE